MFQELSVLYSLSSFCLSRNSLKLLLKPLSISDRSDLCCLKTSLVAVRSCRDVSGETAALKGDSFEECRGRRERKMWTDSRCILKKE